MPVGARTLELLVKAGLTGEALIEVVRSIDADHAPKKSSGAERQAAYRARNKAKPEGDITGDVTEVTSPRDVTGDEEMPSPLEANRFPPDPLPKAQTPLKGTPLKSPQPDRASIPAIPDPPPMPNGSEASGNGKLLTVIDATDLAEFAEFAEFWQAYPHKVGKPEAREAHRRAISGHKIKGKPARKPVSHETIMAGLGRYRAWAEAKKRAEPKRDFKWLNPATFLNGERWTDEHADVDTGGGNLGVFNVMERIEDELASRYFEPADGSAAAANGRDPGDHGPELRNRPERGEGADDAAA